MCDINNVYLWDLTQKKSITSMSENRIALSNVRP